MRSTIRALIVANEYLESEVSELMKAISHALCAREISDLFRLGTNHDLRAEALSRKPEHVAAVAFSRTGDPATGDFGDAKMIKKFGEVPDDLSTL
jgi:hypothetical protein